MKKVLLISIYSFLLCILFSVHAYANLLENGSFESGLNGWDYTWNVELDSVGDLSNLGIDIGNNSSNNLVVNLGSGLTYFYRDGAAIAQNFDTTPGTSYVVSFLVASPKVVSPNSWPYINETLSASTLNVSIDGVNIINSMSFDMVVNSLVWNTCSFTFTADDASTTIAFNSPSGGYWSPVIDDVSIDELSAPVPEPATMLLIGSCLFGLAGLRKRFFKK